jgi:hypothetical protein
MTSLHWVKNNRLDRFDVKRTRPVCAVLTGVLNFFRENKAT